MKTFLYKTVEKFKAGMDWTGPITFMMACALMVGLMASKRSNGGSLSAVEREWAAQSAPELVRKLDDTNKQLARIASALEIIAGTGNQSWKAPK